MNGSNGKRLSCVATVDMIGCFQMEKPIGRFRSVLILSAIIKAKSVPEQI